MINLLPPKEKEELKLYRIFTIVNTLGVISFTILAALILSLTIAGFFADGRLKSKEIEAEGSLRQLEMAGTKQAEEQMNKYNALCRNLNNFYTKQVNIADKIATIANSLPEGIILTQMAINNDGTVSITGLSKDRETLAKMQTNLENLPDIASIIIPPSAWVGENNSHFDVIIKYNANAH